MPEEMARAGSRKKTEAPESNSATPRPTQLFSEKNMTGAELKAMKVEEDAIYERAVAAGHPCGRCGAVWTGANRSHCTGCHQTFSSVGTFDAHRRDLQCVNPEAIRDGKGKRLLFFRDGMWKGEEFDFSNVFTKETSA